MDTSNQDYGSFIKFVQAKKNHDIESDQVLKDKANHMADLQLEVRENY